MDDRISISISDHVAHVQLARSEKMNALDGRMFSALEEAGVQLEANPEVRAVVLSGAGRAFCAGLDMGNFASMANSDEPGPTLSPPDPRYRQWSPACGLAVA